MLLLTLLASPVLGSQQPPDFPRSQSGAFAVPVARDHVAVMIVEREGGKAGEDRTVTSRSGPWQREVTTRAGKTWTTVINVRTGKSIRFRKSPDGRYASLTISGAAEAIPTSIARTDETDTALGESCTVWTFNTKGSIEKNCLTSDGILLWHHLIGGQGRVLESARAISVSRSAVGTENVAPPPDLLDLASWGQWPRKTPPGPNDEVILKDSLDPTGPKPSGATLRIRRLGTFSFNVDSSPRGRALSYKSPTLAITIEQDATGRLRSLDASRIVPSASAHTDLKPAGPGMRKTFLGQECTVHVPVSFPTDVAYSACLTADGIMLSQYRSSMISTRLLDAVALSRGKLTIADVAPPPDILRSD